MPDHPLTTPAASSHMKYLTSKLAIPMPHPPQMSNKGNYVVSLSQLTRWLGSVAEESGVEVYPGFAGAQLLYDANGAVRGVATHDAGLDKRLNMKQSFEPGMAFRARVTLLAEGAHGSLTKQAIKRFKLREGKEPQTYGMGVKEVWRVDPKNYRPGEVIHTMGFPLDYRTYGGGFAYHMDGGLVSLGLVIGLDYANPYLSPYKELQVCSSSLASLLHSDFYRRRNSNTIHTLHPSSKEANASPMQLVHSMKAASSPSLASTLPVAH
jgi:electron-transferring-flavoprotein dehydrogenase